MARRTGRWRQAPLSTEGLLEALRQQGGQPEGLARRRGVWQALTSASAEADFEVGLALAIGSQLVSETAAEQLRRQHIGRTTNTYWINPTDQTEMAWIPSGGCPLGQGNRWADLPGFSLARHPVTNSQFETFLRATSYEPPEDHPEVMRYLAHWTGLEETLIGRALYMDEESDQQELEEAWAEIDQNARAIPEGRAKHPVTWVSSADAYHYCRWAGLLLPTEWMWEKAARGPEGRPFPWCSASQTALLHGQRTVWSLGHFAPHQGTFANVDTGRTVPVGSYNEVRSTYGCEDLIGNVAEWCQSVEGDDLDRPPSAFPRWAQKPSDTSRPELFSVRGTPFLPRDVNRMPAWHRRRLSATRRNHWVGFRPAFTLWWLPPST